VLAHKYGLKIEWHNTMLRWEHENGSIGYLMGADDDDQIETLRGLEADLYIIDEAGIFAPARLRKLLTEIIAPQRASRQGRVVLIGTPGYLAKGAFWEATCPKAKDEQNRPYHINFGTKDPWGRTPQDKSRPWSRHHWTLQDNRPMAHQWDEALITKEQNRWPDDHPIWRREYLGEWVDSYDGLVYRYADAKSNGGATWYPEPTKENPVGLPPEGAPWRFIGGLDIGFEEPTAFVVCAYSPRLRQLRHVWDTSRSHMVVDDVADMLTEAYTRFGSIEKIYADAGALGKMVVETLVRRGFPIEKAEKREKWDHIELLNSALSRGEVLIVPGDHQHSEDEYTLEDQLLTNAWDLSKGDRDELARTGRLREDPAIPNDTADAFLYAYRGSLHHFGQAEAVAGPAYGTPEWVKQHEREMLNAARASFKQSEDHRLVTNIRAPSGVRRALQAQWEQTLAYSRRF